MKDYAALYMLYQKQGNSVKDYEEYMTMLMDFTYKERWYFENRFLLAPKLRKVKKTYISRLSSWLKKTEKMKKWRIAEKVITTGVIPRGYTYNYKLNGSISDEELCSKISELKGKAELLNVTYDLLVSLCEPPAYYSILTVQDLRDYVLNNRKHFVEGYAVLFVDKAQQTVYTSVVNEAIDIITDYIAVIEDFTSGVAGWSNGAKKFVSDLNKKRKVACIAHISNLIKLLNEWQDAKDKYSKPELSSVYIPLYFVLFMLKMTIRDVCTMAFWAVRKYFNLHLHNKYMTDLRKEQRQIIKEQEKEFNKLNKYLIDNNMTSEEYWQRMNDMGLADINIEGEQMDPEDFDGMDLQSAVRMHNTVCDFTTRSASNAFYKKIGLGDLPAKDRPKHFAEKMITDWEEAEKKLIDPEDL